MCGNIHRLLLASMGAGKRKNKNVCYLIIFSLLSQLGLLSAQVAYFQSYEDFIKNNPLPPSRIGTPPFWRVLYEQGHPLEITQIDSTGAAVERQVYRYDNSGSLLQTERYSRERLVQTRNYQPDSLQNYLLRQMMAEPNYRQIGALLTVVNYDSLQRPQLIQIEDYVGVVVGTIAKFYGRAGELLREEVYKGNKERLLGYTEFEYDSVMTMVQQYDGEGHLRSGVRLPLGRGVSGGRAAE